MTERMEIKWYSHLPGVALTDHKNFELVDGYLTELSFGEWVKLDDSFPYDERKYNANKPVFYIGQTNLTEDIDQTRKRIEDFTHLLNLAFLLSPMNPTLPTPHLSITYLTISTSHGVAGWKLIGPFEQEWIVFGNKILYHFDEYQLRIVKNNYEILSHYDLGNSSDPISYALDTIFRTSFPEFWWHRSGINKINEFIHCMMSLESLLLPTKDDYKKNSSNKDKSKNKPKINITNTFGKHASVIASNNYTMIEGREETFSNLYRLRSRLIHGEIGISDLSNNEWNLLLLGRDFLRYVIICSIKIKKKIKEPLPMILYNAYKDPEYHQNLVKILESG